MRYAAVTAIALLRLVVFDKVTNEEILGAVLVIVEPDGRRYEGQESSGQPDL